MMETHEIGRWCGETDDGFPIYVCPHCRNEAAVEECDVMGADEGCVFCNQCSLEFKPDV